LPDKRTQPAGAFTIVELIVVLAVIALILVIAVPGLSAITLESRLNAAAHDISGTLTRAYYGALSDVNMTAVRFLPGPWDYDPRAEASLPRERQHMVSYRYATTSNPPNLGFYQGKQNLILFSEYFQRQPGTASSVLPEDIGVAPVEALDSEPRWLREPVVGNVRYRNFGRDFVLAGTRGKFVLDAPVPAQSFLHADDFLVVFDPQGGLRAGVPTPVRLNAYVPNDPDTQNRYREAPGRETDRDIRGNVPTFYERYSFSGIVLYRREPFLAVGDDPAARQALLKARGRPYLVHRFGGGLVMGTPGR